AGGRAQDPVRPSRLAAGQEMTLRQESTMNKILIAACAIAIAAPLSEAGAWGHAGGWRGGHGSWSGARGGAPTAIVAARPAAVAARGTRQVIEAAQRAAAMARGTPRRRRASTTMA